MTFKNQNWEKALPLLPQNSFKTALNLELSPIFFDGGFIYRAEAMEKGKKTLSYMRVNPKNGEQSRLFDHDELAAALHTDRAELDIEIKDFDGSTLTFKHNNTLYDWKNGELCEKKLVYSQNFTISPNKKWAVCQREGNLFLADENGAERQLTTDGAPEHGYALRNEGDNSFVSNTIAGKISPAAVLWSPKSDSFITWKLDMRGVRKMHLLQTVAKGDRPVLHSYRCALPGDEVIPTFTLYIGDISGRITPVQMEPSPFLFFDAQTMLGIHTGWSNEGNVPLMCCISRDHRRADYYKIDPHSGKTELIFTDTEDSFLFFDFIALSGGVSIFHYSEKDDCLYALSERSGYNHIYKVKNGEAIPLTEGSFTVNRYLHEDEEYIYFSACGKEENILPLQAYTYRVPKAGGEPEVLARRRGNHQAFFPKSGGYFLSSVSSCDQPQTAVLYTLSGVEVCEIASGDCAALEDAGLTYPIGFCEKGADGVTDIYGIIVMPSGFDGSKKYPLVDYYYGGNQTSNVPQTFAAYLNCGFIAALSTQEVVTVVLDGRGTPGRGKAFHAHCHRNMGDCAGLEDHVAVINSLCKKFPFIDGERVGVWGHSGGGFASFQCMTKHPELYKCAVSSGGNHLQELYVWDWAERYMAGNVNVREQSAEALAGRLEGKLMLIHGELDDNVHPANTMRIANALIKADKQFDMFIFPGKHHLLRDDPYFQRMVIKYLVENL